MKKILILGGKPIGSIELVKAAKERGLYTIVADYLPASQSPAKLMADESWNISTAEVDKLSELCIKHNVNGVATGVHEFNIARMLEISNRVGLPTYCTPDTWRFCENKIEFKNLCKANNLPVATKYDTDINDPAELGKLVFPVITKPEDGSGSRGFAISYNPFELAENYETAKQFSPTGKVIIEDYIPYDAVIIHYTMINGKCFYSGMSDKISVTFPSTGAKVMGIQTFPSTGEKIFLDYYDEKVRSMFEKAGFTNGPIWIEAFYDGGNHFVFNEMGYRFGGSLTYYPVRYFHGIDQLGLMIDNAMNDHQTKCISPSQTASYCILPIHIRSGKITQISGWDEVHDREDINAIVPVHYLNDEIQEWGSAQQVFCYLHIIYNTKEQLKHTVSEVLFNLQVFDEAGNNMLYPLFDINAI